MRDVKEELRKCRRVTVMGLGQFGGGAGAARYFAELGCDVIVTDAADENKLASSIASLDGLSITFILGRHRREDFTNTDLVVANQAVRPDNHLLADARAVGVPVATETGLALALNRSPWLGVTGSSGKSTTTALAADMLARHDADCLLGGNIGGDLLTRVEGRRPDCPLVAELSSFQLIHIGPGLADGEIDPPTVAVVTNLAPNHLDWHRNYDEYLEAKRQLICHQQPQGWTILNYDDAELRRWGDATPARLLWFSLSGLHGDNACAPVGDALNLRIGGNEIASWPLASFRLRGSHNLANAAAASAAAYLMGAPVDCIGAGLAEFPGLPHRLQLVGSYGDKTFINDSKSTTPEAACLALRTMTEPTVLIAGGYDKKADFTGLGKEIRMRASGLVLLGDSGPRILEAVKNAFDAMPDRSGGLDESAIISVDTFADAVRQAARLCPVGGVVLLSPACASWGMFINYEDRGKQFAALAALAARS